MIGDFRSVALSGPRVSQALPLIQTAWPHVNARAWQGYSRFFLTRLRRTKAGIVAICDSSDYLCGLFAYEVRPDLHDGLVLAVPLFMGADLQNSTVLIGNLLDAARQKARDFACAGLQIRLYPEQPSLRTRLRTLGLSERAGYLCEHISPTRSSH